MNIKTINYSKIFPTSAYLNERIGVEIAINEGENVMDALGMAKGICEEFHRDSNPGLYIHKVTDLTADEAAAIKGIELSDTLQKLAVFKSDLTKNTRPYYKGKLQTLTGNFKTHD